MMDLELMITQCVIDSTKWFPGRAQELPNLVLCMCGEAGEVANLTKKIVRGSVQLDDVREDLAEEIVDVMIYLCNLMGAKEFKDVNWESVWNAKRDFNDARFGSYKDVRHPATGLDDVPEDISPREDNNA